MSRGGRWLRSQVLLFLLLLLLSVGINLIFDLLLSVVVDPHYSALIGLVDINRGSECQLDFGLDFIDFLIDLFILLVLLGYVLNLLLNSLLLLFSWLIPVFIWSWHLGEGKDLL